MNQKSDSNNTAGAVAQERLVLPFFRVVVTKLEGGHRWSIVSNPKWCHVTRGQSAILDNTCNDYSFHIHLKLDLVLFTKSMKCTIEIVECKLS